MSAVAEKPKASEDETLFKSGEDSYENYQVDNKNLESVLAMNQKLYHEIDHLSTNTEHLKKEMKRQLKALESLVVYLSKKQKTESMDTSGKEEEISDEEFDQLLAEHMDQNKSESIGSEATLAIINKFKKNRQR